MLEFLHVSLKEVDLWPKPLHLIQGALLIREGQSAAAVARKVGTTVARLTEIVTQPDIAAAVLRITDPETIENEVSRLRRNVGQMVLSRAAEIAFEEICREHIDPKEFELKDLRHGRTNTDYRLLNGGKRPLYRFNVKFFGSVFRRGAELVNLEPTDCFPLATYKIHAALQEQEREHLPYVFAVVGVPDLGASAVAACIPEQEIKPLAMLFASDFVRRKRDFEDRFVDRIVSARSEAFMAAYNRIRGAQWYVLSARRADVLLHEKLFDRVYALRVSNFAKQFGGAEVDMHFSLRRDLVSIEKFLEILRTDGQGKLTSMLERGTH